MTVRSHGTTPHGTRIITTTLSSSISIAQVHSLARPMRRSPHGATGGVAGVGNCLQQGQQCRRPFATTPSQSSSSSVFSSHHNRPSLMDSGRQQQQQQQQTWHLSRGIVFANDTRVVYPRLPVARYHSEPVLASSSSNADIPPTIASASAAGLKTEPLSRDAAPGSVIARPRSTEDKVTVVDQTAPETSVVAHEQQQQQPESEGKVEEEIKAPFTPLEFKIPDETFREAKKAAEGTPESFWTYSLYRGPGEDGKPTKVKVHYCKSNHTTERVLQQYFMNEKVIGFDLEWTPDATKAQGPRKNVCVAQIASASRIAIFHLSLFPKKDDLVAPSFRKLMEDPEITKCGVWIKGDCTRLKKFLGIQSRGLFELSHLYKLVKYSTSKEYNLVNKRLCNLAVQVQEYLQLPLFKGQDVRASDWSQELRMDQIIYSASDAYAAVQLYAVLDHHRQKLDPTPPLPHHAELNRPIQLADGIVIPTADEAPEEDTTAAAPTGGPVLTARYLASLGETIKIEPENGELSEPILPEEALVPTSKKSPAVKPPKDPRIIEAAAWAAEYRAKHPNCRASMSALRCFELWRKNPDLDSPDKIAALLRTPPLMTGTVVNYVLEAVRAVRSIPYDRVRLLNEILRTLPEDILAIRYKTILRECEMAATVLERARLRELAKQQQQQEQAQQTQQTQNGGMNE